MRLFPLMLVIFSIAFQSIGGCRVDNLSSRDMALLYNLRDCNREDLKLLWAKLESSMKGLEPTLNDAASYQQYIALKTTLSLVREELLFDLLGRRR